MAFPTHPPASSSTKPNGESVFVTAPDGLKLHVRVYGPRAARGWPVICLPGLSRTVADFETLALALSNDGGSSRRVLALDYRGRGRSEHDRNPKNYSLPIELADVLAMLTALAALPAIFVGTSRGGILTMLLAAVRPAAIAGVVLNDIGPVVEPKGLMRIRGYVGKLPAPNNFEEGADILRRLFSAQFPRLTQAEWLAAARKSWEERSGQLIPTYDPRLARTFDGIDLERPLPALWAQFDGLARVPVMVIRGANSDILSMTTVEAMRARRPDLDVVEVADQGHAPWLEDAETIQRITDFILRCDAQAQIV